MHYFDNRPVGLNNTNHLVNTHFNPDSFAVVQQVHSNLRLLRELYNNIPMFQSIGASYLSFENLSKYVGDILNISNNLSSLVQLNSNIPLLKDIAPMVNEFADKQKDIEVRLEANNREFREVLGLMESNTKHLEDLYCQYEHSLSCLLSSAKLEISELANAKRTELECLVKRMEELHNDLVTAMPFVNQAAKEQGDNKLLLEHLLTSDLVTTAIFTGLESDYDVALKQIKESEKFGNNESINRQRLNYKLEDNNVLGVLRANQERLTKE